jgi:O-antigen ligase
MLRYCLDTLLFVFVLFPLTISSSDGLGLSLNYSFIFLIPLIVKFTFRFNRDANIYLVYLFISGAIGVFINSIVLGVDASLIIRQLLSLVVACLPAIFLYCDLEKYYDKFKDACIISAFIYSLFAIFIFIREALLVGINPFMMKEVLANFIPDWPQRFILVLFAGYFFIFDTIRYRSSLFKLIQATIFICIIISFLRAAYLCLMAAYLFMIISKRYGVASNFNNEFNAPSRVARLFFGLILLFSFIFLYTNKPEIFDAIGLIVDNLYISVADLFSGKRSDNLSDETRIDIFKTIIELMIISPVTGFGGAGIYVFSEEFASAHNQYLDYLIRFGFLGLLIFIYFNARLIFYFWNKEPYAIAIIISFIFFGIAHETTKYSYGAVIFYFLLSMTYRKKLKDRKYGTNHTQ